MRPPQQSREAAATRSGKKDEYLPPLRYTGNTETPLLKKGPPCDANVWQQACIGL